MILIRKYNGGTLSFRTSGGVVNGELKEGMIYVDVDPSLVRQMKIIHKFYNKPLEREVEKKPVVEKKKVVKKAPAKKRTTRKKKKPAE